ncbi:hypothetical protein VDF13_05185 [Xanthomonas campestris pv. raphani]|uniref:hypothetical protein n=1 Tax=Xanthomonas campestris TaxID=339 RepID=UPI002B2359A8|nr:hypothetical protein [Xanthomonas campestris]MEA9649577.1 hypothetical protein [Xanthomonas campestris pv. raphani]MEA9743079.1 hypothetical protein [Xanthomonas campestris pv. raphani]MEA9766641.1 hypothetical protein [Xanthomonas campestris pv. raphani]MEA9867719.1 hypothetical protein [Xanthomonas campestris pv. raphani]
MLLPHLASDAVVHDELPHHRGAAAIAAWLVHYASQHAVSCGAAWRAHPRRAGARHRASIGRFPAEPAAVGACVSAGGRQDCGVGDSLTQRAA